MKSINKLFYFLIVFGFLQACNDPIVVGSDLLDSDHSQLNSKTLNVQVKTVTEDSVLVYSNTGIVPKLLDNYAIGNLSDPIFGKMSADIFAQLSLPAKYIAPNFKDATLDSIVLRLALADPNFMEDTTIMNTIEVYELTDLISDNLEEVYSNQSFAYDSKVIGSATFRNDRDSVLIYNVKTDGSVDTVNLAPHVNIHLDADYAQKLMDIDSMTYTDNGDFKEIIKGFRIAGKDGSGHLTNLRFKTINSRMSIYYSKNGERKQFNYFFEGGAVLEHLDYDYTGSECEKSINGDTDYCYIQGLSGTNVEIQLQDLDQLDNVLINKAVLEFYIADVTDPEGILNNNQLVLATKSDDGQLTFIADAAHAFTAKNYRYFGGQLIEKDGLKKYELNISSYLQSALKGDTPTTIILRSSPKPSDLRRSIFFGSGHTTYSPKIRITYTQL